MRRTAATIRVPDDLAALLPRHPFVAPVDGSFYFKPEPARSWSASPRRPPPSLATPMRTISTSHVALERFHAATIVPRARPIATWAGLRTFAPDRLPVVGFDAEVKSFFWYAGQGGTASRPRRRIRRSPPSSFSARPSIRLRPKSPALFALTGSASEPSIPRRCVPVPEGLARFRHASNVDPQSQRRHPCAGSMPRRRRMNSPRFFASMGHQVSVNGA